MVNCWDAFVFNTTTCAWDNTGTQAPMPAMVNCWDAFVFNTTTCAWDNTGVQHEVTIEVTSGSNPSCEGASVTLTAQSDSAEFWMWNTGEITSSIVVTTEGWVSVDVTDQNGCSATDSMYIEINPIPDVYAGEDVNMCVGDDVMLTATGGNENTVYTWSLDGEVVATTQSITVSPGVGLSEYTVMASNEFCSTATTDDVKVWVNDYPLAGFERDPAGDVPFGSEVNFTDTTLGFVTDWHWDFGDGMTSMLQNPSHDYADPGSYWVELIASNNGCEDTARAGLEVKVIINIPNVFTPNNDGVNDIISVEGTNLELIKITIYNRWGHSVYANEGRQFSWTGKNMGGQDADSGTYYYVIEMNYKDGNTSEQTGFFTLIR
jgi:gliding motility-associated-like protein